MKTKLYFDKAFKFGVSWDIIRGLGVTRVFLVHFGPLVLSFAWCIVLLMSSCVAVRETMTRPDGSRYTFTSIQAAGAGEAHGSSGAGHTFDGQKSFQDFLSMVGVGIAGWSQVAANQAKQLSARYSAGELTKQQSIASMERIRISESTTAARRAVTGEAISKAPADAIKVPAITAP
jgi:hypothetical protein